MFVSFLLIFSTAVRTFPAEAKFFGNKKMFEIILKCKMLKNLRGMKGKEKKSEGERRLMEFGEEIVALA